MRRGLCLLLLLAACSSVPPRQQFVQACATTGEAMIGVMDARRAGKVDVVTFRQIDDLYDAAVETCDTMPASDDAATIGLGKVEEFLRHASGVTGKNYAGGY